MQRFANGHKLIARPAGANPGIGVVAIDLHQILVNRAVVSSVQGEERLLLRVGAALGDVLLHVGAAAESHGVLFRAVLVVAVIVDFGVVRATVRLDRVRVGRRRVDGDEKANGQGEQGEQARSDVRVRCDVGFHVKFLNHVSGAVAPTEPPVPPDGKGLNPCCVQLSTPIATLRLRCAIPIKMLKNKI